MLYKLTIIAAACLMANNVFAQAKQEFAGDLQGKKTVLVAWSFDDGPVAATDTLKSKLGVNNVTWFIVKKNMLTQTGKWDKNIARYKAIQDAGGEIGLHAQHETVDHIIWFPAPKGTKYECYDKIETAMAELKTFKAELEKGGVKSKFTRLPGGLISQLAAYARHFGFAKNSTKAATAVLNGKSFESLGLPGPPDTLKKLKTSFQKIETDFATFKTSLKGMKVLLWANTKNPSQIKPMSWEAESSGTLSLNDNITYSVTLKAEREKKYPGYSTKIAGKFERLADKMKDGERRSWLILAHDTSDKNIAAILEDKATMEAYATKKGIKIEYVTMSTLFNRTTGKDAEKFKPDY